MKLLHRLIIAALIGAPVVLFATDMTASMVDMWEMKESSGNITGAHAAISLTETGGTIGTVACGGSGRALRDFEQDSTQYFTTADSSALSLGSDTSFTIVAFVDGENYTNGGANQVIAAKNDNTSGGEWALSHVDAFGFQLRVYGGDSDYQNDVYIGGGDITAVGCAMVACWHDAGADQVGCSLNAGSANTQAHTNGTRDSTKNFTIGAFDGGIRTWDGGIGQVIFIKGAVLSGANLTEIYNSAAGVDYSDISGGGGGGLPCTLMLMGIGKCAPIAFAESLIRYTLFAP